MNEAKLEPDFFHVPERYEERDDLPCCEDVLDNRSQATLCPVCQASCFGLTPHNLTRCLVCHHIFQTDLAVTVSYDANYAHQYDRLPVKEMSDLRWNFIQSCLNLTRGSRVLDVGYGNGAFLKRACGAGMSIFGADVHTEDFGIPVVDLETKISFDLISFFDSLEHFPSFAPLLRLRSKNVIVSIPQTPDFILDAPRRWRHYKPGEHLHYFSHRSLDTFMAQWGFQRKLAQGYPEDSIRGKLSIDGEIYDNIYTAIYTSAEPDRTHRS
jgi:SAM-dependent methyltransferase